MQSNTKCSDRQRQGTPEQWLQNRSHCGLGRPGTMGVVPDLEEFNWVDSGGGRREKSYRGIEEWLEELVVQKLMWSRSEVCV